MPCLLGCLAVFMPRLVLLALCIFTNYLGEAYQTVLWPLLGFFLMPYTTLAYAWAWHWGAGSISGFGLVVVVLAVLIDLGAHESGRRTTASWSLRRGRRVDQGQIRL
jgi:hypothetical protein